jgi:hypothetical protein
MKALTVEITPRSRKLLLAAGCGVLVIILLANLPFLIDALSRLADWFTGLFPHPNRLWEESPWLY